MSVSRSFCAFGHYGTGDIVIEHKLLMILVCFVIDSDDRVTSSSSLMTVKDTLSRIELIRAETGRQLAAAAVQQANAAAQNAEAAMRQAHAWERNAEGLLALANAISNIALMHRPQNE